MAPNVKSKLAKVKTSKKVEKVGKNVLKRKTVEKHKNNTGKKNNKEQEEEEEEEVVVDFEFFNMSEGDFHTVKQFLSVTFGPTGHPINLSELASFITEELADHVGTTVKSDGEQSDPLAVCTCVPVRYFPEKSTPLVSFLQSHMGEEYKIKDGTAIVLFERFMNLPAGIAGPVLSNLLADWQNAMKEDPSFKVDQVIYMTPVYDFVKSALDEEMGLQAEDPIPEESDEKENFYYQEAEYLKDFATHSFTFKPVSPHSTTDSRRAFSEKGIDASRMLYIMSFKKFTEYVDLVNEKLID